MCACVPTNELLWYDPLTQLRRIRSRCVCTHACVCVRARAYVQETHANEGARQRHGGYNNKHSLTHTQTHPNPPTHLRRTWASTALLSHTSTNVKHTFTCVVVCKLQPELPLHNSHTPTNVKHTRTSAKYCFQSKSATPSSTSSSSAYSWEREKKDL